MSTNKFLAFPKIGQYRNMCKEVEAHCKYHEILDKPTIEVTGSTKVHGTNAAIVYSAEYGLNAQSRSRVITPESDNAGFAQFVADNKDDIIYELETYITNGETVYVFGEWAGPGVQKGVAVSHLENRMFFPFYACVVTADGEQHDIMLPLFPENPEIMIMPLFGYWKMEIDFNKPEVYVEDLIKITEEVEKQCPVGKYFGITGIGEGVVWIGKLPDGSNVRFKVKGEKHSVSKVKKLASVDVEKMASIREFVEYAVTINRLKQGIDEVFTQNGLEPDIKMMGDYIRWVHNDVLKEESDTLAENGLERKDYGKELSDTTRSWFMKEYC